VGTVDHRDRGGARRAIDPYWIDRLTVADKAEVAAERPSLSFRSIRPATSAVGTYTAFESAHRQLTAVAPPRRRPYSASRECWGQLASAVAGRVVVCQECE